MSDGDGLVITYCTTCGGLLEATAEYEYNMYYGDRELKAINLKCPRVVNDPERQMHTNTRVPASDLSWLATVDHYGLKTK